MASSLHSATGNAETLEIIAFRLHGQEFCVKTTTIREIRGWSPSRPLPHAPEDVVGVMNLRGNVIPIIDLARTLGMESTAPSERSAIVVAEVHGVSIGRSGSVCLNSFGRFAKWISASIMLPPSSATAR